MTTLAITTERVSKLAHAFAAAVASTPEDEPLIDRAQSALAGMPDDVVRELGAAADLLFGLTQARLGGGVVDVPPIGARKGDRPPKGSAG